MANNNRFTQGMQHGKVGIAYLYSHCNTEFPKQMSVNITKTRKHGVNSLVLSTRDYKFSIQVYTVLVSRTY